MRLPKHMVDELFTSLENQNAWPARGGGKGLKHLKSQYELVGAAHWIKRHDTATGKVYYFNTDTEVSVRVFSLIFLYHE